MENENLITDVVADFKRKVYDAKKPYSEALKEVRNALSAKSGDKVIEKGDELKNRIRQCITERKIRCNLSDDIEVLVDYMYHDMAGLSFITRDKLFELPGFEELLINAWNSIEIVINGERKLTDYSFLSLRDCIDLHRKIFSERDKVLDNTTPRVTTDICPGIRITTWGVPIVDAEVGIVSAIRKVNNTLLGEDEIIDRGLMTQEMFDFLALTILCGSSICLSGETSSGKTTLTSALLKLAAANDKRVLTVEEDSRELQCVDKDDNGKPINSVVHALTVNNSANQDLSIGQKELMKDTLRMHPDVIALAEIRGSEAYEVMKVANTNHAVITTIHSNSTAETPTRMVSLAQEDVDLDSATLYIMTTAAFPVLVHIEKCKDGARRVMEIRQVDGYSYGEIVSHLIYEFDIDDNIYDDNGICIQTKGEFRRVGAISREFAQRLKRKGATKAQLLTYLSPPKDKGGVN